MDQRYVVPTVAEIWSDANKLALWQKTELAVIEAGVGMGTVPNEAFERIRNAWTATPVDIAWWKARDAEIHHDLNAFVDERLRHLPTELHQYVHRKITSYDTQEAALERMILDCFELFGERFGTLLAAVAANARKYRYTVMNARTHGQEAELQTFGSRCLSWYQELATAFDALDPAAEDLRRSKLSGAIGKYGGISPELEARTLAILGFTPFYGATQIMPRVTYARAADALCRIVLVIEKIAHDIRLGARSGRPIMREPFSKKQKGSSAMPHKRNPIRLEQLEGMARTAKGYAAMLRDNIHTWEERSIEQSSVERVAWPDLFHVAIHSVNVLAGVLNGLVVYPENMLAEVYESRGTYASSEAKEFLKKRLAPFGLRHEDAYRIVQLASFNAFEPTDEWARQRQVIPQSLADADDQFVRIGNIWPSRSEIVSIRDIILHGSLRESPELDVPSAAVEAYNVALRRLFADSAVMREWDGLFLFSPHIRNEATLYAEILGE